MVQYQRRSAGEKKSGESQTWHTPEPKSLHLFFFLLCRVLLLLLFTIFISILLPLSVQLRCPISSPPFSLIYIDFLEIFLSSCSLYFSLFSPFDAHKL